MLKVRGNEEKGKMRDMEVSSALKCVEVVIRV
jgi:hypothetical protein